MLPTLALEPASLPEGDVGEPYLVDFTSPNATPPVTFSLSSGELPPGLTLSTEGQLSGRPLSALTAAFTLTAVDAQGAKGSQSFSLTVRPPRIAIGPTVLPTAFRATSYLQQLTASGGNPPYLYELTSGSLPSGVTLSNSGVLSGRPTALGVTTFSVRARDAVQRTGEQSFSLTVTEPTVTITPTSLANASVGLDYVATLTATGGSEPYTFALDGTLPDGLTLGAGGAITGRPTTAGSTNFAVQVVDANALAARQSYLLTVDPVAFAVEPPALPPATLGFGYSVTIRADGGVAPYDFSVIRGALPTGFTLTTIGVLTGVPIALGTSNFTVRATDATSTAASRSFSLEVRPATIALTPGTVPAAPLSSAYSVQFAADGGVGPYLFSVSAGQLPPGLQLLSSGALSGTSRATAVVTNFTVTAVDTFGSAGSVAYRLAVTDTAYQLGPAMLPDGTVSMPYPDTQLTPEGGAAPHTFAIVRGALPAGISLSATGLLSGTPTQSGTFAFTASATDANLVIAHRDFTLVVQ